MSYIDNTRRSNNDSYVLTVCLTKEDCQKLLPFFVEALKKVNAKYEQYKDIHEGGEANERQENLLVTYDEKKCALERVLADIHTLLS